MPFRLTFAALLIAALPASAQERVFDSSAGRISVSQQVDGLSQPWGFTFLPGGGVLVTEKGGDLHIARGGVLSPAIAGVPEVVAERQGGLLDVALAPDFAESGEIYLSYAAPTKGGNAQTAVARARLIDGDAPRLDQVEVIFRQEPARSTRHHYGSRILVAPDGSLFITVGDRGGREEAQNPASHQGSVIRILRDGAPHPDNPFVDGARGWKPEIYSFGHRNPQGAAMGSDGVLWTVEHGAKGGDELNRPVAGANHGWPVISYGRHYSGAKIGAGTSAPGMTQPIAYWDPSIAPSGLAVYEGEMFPEWRGDILVGALKFQLIARLELEDGRVAGEERLFSGEYGRIRDVRVAPDGAIWFATDSRNGGLYRISRAE